MESSIQSFKLGVVLLVAPLLGTALVVHLDTLAIIERKLTASLVP